MAKKGEKINEATKRRMRLAAIERNKRPEYIAKLRKAALGKVISPKQREMARVAMTGNKNALGHKGLFDEKNGNWKGNAAGYAALHKWVQTHLGKPSKCEHCHSAAEQKYEWANKDHKYRRVKEDWIRLCTNCHRKYDIRMNNYRVAFLGS